MYLVDIITFSENEDRHVEYILKVILRLEVEELKKKCLFFKSDVTFVEHPIFQ